MINGCRDNFRTPELWDFARIPECMHLALFMEYWSTGVLDFIDFYPLLHHSNTPLFQLGIILKSCLFL
jgi:hypothetical protein